MLACTGYQTSAALGNYSTFAKAFADAMAGGGDLSRDGKNTPGEMKSSTKTRTDQLVAGARASNQDGIVAASPSLSEGLDFAYLGPPAPRFAQNAAPPPRPTQPPALQVGLLATARGTGSPSCARCSTAAAANAS